MLASLLAPANVEALEATLKNVPFGCTKKCRKFEMNATFSLNNKTQRT